MNSITDTDLKTLWHIQIKYCNYSKINIIKNLFCLIWTMNVIRKLSTSVILYVGESTRDRFSRTDYEIAFAGRKFTRIIQHPCEHKNDRFIRLIHRVYKIFNFLHWKYARDCGSHHYWRPTTIIWRCLEQQFKVTIQWWMKLCHTKL